MPEVVELLTLVFRRSAQWTLSLVLLTCTAAMLAMPRAQAQTFTVLHSFDGLDGAGPYAGITLDPLDHNLWGVTNYGGLQNCDLGGPVGCGVIYRLSRGNSGNWGFSVPFIFPASGDIFLPVFPTQITIGPNDVPYGAELEGGTLFVGTVYELSPPAASNHSWTHTVLHQFGSGEDGSYPHKIIFDPAGNIYGTTARGGTFDEGTVYELSPSGQGWTENILYSFAGGSDGLLPRNVVLDDAGNLYGISEQGGNAGCSPFQGCGTIFELTRSGSGWIKTTLYSFQQDTDGGFPGPLMRDSSGNLFGVTGQNGANNFGTIWELSPSSGGWKFTVLYSFTQQTSALLGPFAPVMDASGSLVGFNNSGGVNNCGDGFEEGCGNIYKLAPTGNSWVYSDVYDFATGGGGCLPVGPPAIDTAGNIYGATYGCGAGVGVVFKFTP